MRKIWIIARNNIIGVFTDRNLILIMLVTPLVLATIIALAFSNVSTTSAPITDVPVALVNMDEGAENGFNAGQIMVSALLPGESDNQDTPGMGSCEQASMTAATDDSDTPAPFSLETLTEATLLEDAETARAGVDAGDYAAAIIIPPDFSQRMSYTQDQREIDPVPLEVYGDSARPISAGIIRSIAEGFTNQFMTGQVTVAATIETLVARAQEDSAFGLAFLAASTSGEFQPDFACAFTGGFNTLNVEQQTIGGEEVQFSPLIFIGAAQAIFFALFTAMGGAGDILEERRNGTLQRLIVTPTPRSHILAGKALGTFGMVLVQLVFLFIAFTLIASLLEGRIQFIWGTDWVGVAALVLASALGVTGIGMMVAALSKTNEQANIIGGVVSMFMGVLGGAFFSVSAIPILEPLTRLSVVRWGSEGFTKLATGEGDVLVNVVFLLLIGAVTFVAGLWIFNRREDV